LTGQWHEADLVVAHWLQHTSRGGDMQLHVHSQIAHTARTATDGKWRAPDSLGYNEHIGAVAAIVSQHLEEALTRRFGLEWVARDDGHGFEIKGISGDMMRLFSSRRESITARPARTRRAVRAALRTQTIPARTGSTRAGVELHHTQRQDRHARLRAAARGLGGQTRAHTRREPVVRRAIGVARPRPRLCATARRRQPDPRRAGDVIKYLGRVLPPSGRNPAAAAALLEDLADRALRSEFEPIVCLEAPEAVQVPRSLLRAGGRSVYQRHGGVRYATRAQLAMEETATPASSPSTTSMAASSGDTRSR